MPPRIRLSLPVRSICLYTNSVVRSKTFRPAITPSSVNTQQRSASILAQLSDNKGAYNKRIRRGRGPASGKGKTSGRGHKGQKQHGKVPRGFEGGQTPLEVVHGKRGFKNVFAMDLSTVPLTRIQSWVAQGRIDPTKPITVRELLQSRCVHRISEGIKLLASSNSHAQSIDEVPPLTQPLHIVVSRASASAIAAIEKAGGTVTTRYYTKFALRQILKGKMDPIVSIQSRPATMGTATTTTSEASTANFTPALPRQEPALPTKRLQYRLPDATSRKAIEYYRDSARRGYLSHAVEEGKGPSLYFRTPAEEKERLKALANRQGRTQTRSAENLLW